MKNNAVIKVVSIQNYEEDEKIEVVSIGTFCKEEGMFVATYEETELSGMGDTTTTFKIGKHYFNLIREGEINTVMEFKRGHSTSILYNTPQGGLALQVKTRSLKIDINDLGGTVDLEYDIFVDGKQSINTKLMATIDVKQN